MKFITEANALNNHHIGSNITAKGPNNLFTNPLAPDINNSTKFIFLNY